MNFHFPNQNHSRPLSELAKKYNISQSSAYRIAKEMGKVKTRKQYEGDAQIRRKTAYELRQQGLKFKEIADLLEISVNNAQQLVRRYQLTQG